VSLLGQFSFERCDLLLSFGERSRGAADLHDEFVKSSAIQCSPHPRSPEPRPQNRIAEKVYQRLTHARANRLSPRAKKESHAAGSAGSMADFMRDGAIGVSATATAVGRGAAISILTAASVLSEAKP
jgi:hypothetical protein